MATARHLSFIQDKNGFFTIDSLPAAKQSAANKNLKWTNRHLDLLEQEFNDLFAALQNSPQNREAYWLYCYYCSKMLYYYYKAYDKKDKTQEYKNHSKEIKSHYLRQALPAEHSSFFGRLQKKMAQDFSSLITTPFHAAKIKDWASFINITRLQMVFARLTIHQSLFYLKESHVLEKLIHSPVQLERFMNQLNKTAGVFNVLSVGLYAVRFAMNAGILLKHVFLNSADEDTLGYIGRFKREFKSRHCMMLNDAVWGGVNGLTNYAPFFHIPAPVANWTVAAFLIFDLSLLLYRRWLAEEDYLAKKGQYVDELNSKRLTPEHKKLLEEQLQQLEIQWQITNATFWFNITAALLLMSGFSAALFLGTPAAMPVCFLVCALAVSMYVSADTYGTYKKKCLILEAHEGQGIASEKDREAVRAARNQLLFVMAKNTIVPMIIMGTFAVSWQAALLLTVAYVGVELAVGLIKYAGKQEAVAPAP